jgi:hypothetical protein
MRVFFHRLSCEHGGQCEQIDDKKHCKTFRHPDFCVQKGSCKDMSELHLLKYRHVSLCKDGIHCALLIKHDNSHCTTYRHCKMNCKLGLYCNNYHDNEHIEDENHPFERPCPYTPYMCQFYDKLLKTIDGIEDSDSSIAALHCFKYSHVCQFGRQCPNLFDKEHILYELNVRIKIIVNYLPTEII